MDRFEHVAMQMHIEVGKQRIYLNHYPFLCFEGGYKDVWQLFGHVHTRKSNTGAPTDDYSHRPWRPPRLAALAASSSGYFV